MIFIQNKRVFITSLLLVYVFLQFFCSNLQAVYAEVIFSEIMYNPEGTDSGREWIEVYNSGSDSVDLANYKLLENGTSHKIIANTEDGSTILGSNAYAVIVDNPIKFLADFANTSSVFDSAFSLKNTGEEIQIIDPSGISADTVNYLPEWGANGTGNSLQLNDDIWIPAEPTPSAINKTESADESEPDDDNPSSGSSSSSNDDESSHQSQEEISNYKPKVDFKIYSSRKRYVLINTPVEFILEHNQEKDAEVKAIWSFGDGESKKGNKVTHYFYNAGIYNIVVNAKCGDNQAVHRTKVYVTKPLLDITFENRGKAVDILLKNNNKKEVNLGGFSIKTDVKKFKLPSDTIIDAKGQLVLSGRTTKIDSFTELKLIYPNGDTLFESGGLSSSKYFKLVSFVAEDKRDEFWEVIRANSGKNN